MKLYSRDRARRSLFDTIGFRALSQIATVLSYAVLVRGMSEHDFGVINLLYAIIPVVSTVGSLGLDNTLKRFQPEFLLAGQRGESAWLVRFVRRARLGSNLLVIGLILLAWNLIAPWFHLEPYRADFMIFSLMILLYFQVNILQYSLASLMLHRYSVGSVAVVSVGKLVLYTLMWTADEISLLNAILADTLAHGAAYAFLAFHYRTARSAEPLDAVRVPSVSQLGRLKRFAGFSHFNDAASLLTFTETDRLFIARLMNPIAVGAYSFYTRLNDMASSLIPMRLFENVVHPLFFGVPSADAKAKLPRYFTLLLNLNWIYQLPLIVFAFMYHREIVGVVFGGKFIEHSILLPIVVLFGASDNVISIPVTMMAQYKEKASIILVSQSWGIYQVAAMLLLIPMFGLVGAAIATGTFHLFRNLFVWWHVRQEASWINFRAFLVSVIVIWTSAAVLCALTLHYLTAPPALQMLVGMVICSLGALLHLRSPALCSSDRQILADVLHGKESNVLRWIGLLPWRKRPA